MCKELVEFNGQKLEIRKPNNRLIQKAQLKYNIKLASLIKKSALCKDNSLLSRSQLDNYLKEIGIWSENDQLDVFNLQNDIILLAAKLHSGGIKLIDGKRIAIDLRIKRQKLLFLISKRTQYEELTIESLADQYRFKYLMINSLFDENDNLYFKDFDDYENQESDEIIIESGKILASWLFGYKDFENNLIENKFLKKYKFINEDGLLIDRSGDIVDVDGNKIDIDDDQEVKTKPFLDDEGNPIAES